VPHDVALGRHDIRKRLAACEHAEILDVPLQTLLRKAEPLAREVLHPARQHGAGLGHHLKALGSLASEFLAALARDAISLRDLIREAPSVLRGGVQTRPHGVLCLVNLGVNVFTPNFSAAVRLVGCIVSDRHIIDPNIDKYKYA
jgi:hypothetical protein